MWLPIALFGYAIAAAVSILDKFILEKKAVSAAVFSFYSTVFILPIFLLIPFGVGMIKGSGDWLVAVIFAVSFTLGLWTMYKGVQQSEISHLGPFLGATIPVAVFVLSRVFLNEVLSDRQMLAGGLLVLGSLLISFEKSQKHNGWHTGFAWGLAAAIFFAISHVASKYTYNVYGFYSAFVWTRGFLGAAGLVFLLSPAVRQEIFSRHRESKKTTAHRRALVVANKIGGVAAIILVQYAIALGSVSVVVALSGAQFALLVLAVAVLSKFWPKLFKEEYGRAEIFQEIIAVLIIGVGLVLLV
ncbi:MAG: EamA family transporter [Patescibacteria group bacterium]